MIALLVATSFTPFDRTYALTQSTLTVTSQDTSAQAFTGMYTVLFDTSYNVLQTSFTTASFKLSNGQAYLIQVDDYGSCFFSHWSDTGSSINPRSITINANTSISAVYNCGGTGSSGVQMNSIDQNGNAISGYYVVLYDSSGTAIATGFTPMMFQTQTGTTYNLGAGNYGSCIFSKWSDGVTLNPRTFTASNTVINITADYNCGTSTTTSTTTTASGGTFLMINSQGSGGGTITGMYAILQQNGAVIATGFTPVQFSVTKDQTYSVEVQNYGTNYFQYWADTGSVNALQTVTPSSSASFTAVYCSGPPGTCSAPIPVNGITVFVHRIAASYWAPCFALSCSAGTGPGASMYVVLYDSTGAIVQTGFANEQGYTFTGLTPGATYYLYPTDCDLCHGSTHDVVFSYWGANTSSVRPLAVTVGSSEDAWYSCTNGCQ